MIRHYPFPNILNFRDLGGYLTSYGKTQSGLLFRSGDLSKATPEEIDSLADLGIRSVIDLRSAQQKKDTPDKTVGDARFLNIDVTVNGDGRIPKNKQDMLESYFEMIEEPISAKRVFQAIAYCEKPCLIHCVIGKDRTGIFVALLLLHNGVDFMDVNADYMLSYPYIQALVEEAKNGISGYPEELIDPDTLFLKKFMDAFYERYGSLEGYFDQIGLSPDEIRLLGNLLGKQEKSCGAVLLHKGKVLVEHMKKGHFSIPKGHVEEVDEDEHATAQREIKEELGIGVQFVPGFRKRICYSPKTGVAKEVVFFLGEATSTDISV
ncbi:MAG: tyrosine-protein phosphatase, partial [Bacilli bacterium]|nr:tyrosine-protein phosphatase [Bacilli bacterium]